MSVLRGLVMNKQKEQMLYVLFDSSLCGTSGN
jgi:hypothetical protein